MSTVWTSPTAVTQYAEDESHIRWGKNDSDFAKIIPAGVTLSAPLLHISRQPRNDITMKTWFVQATNFNFQNLPNTISGIKFRLTANRVGRVFDDTIQLTCNGTLLGVNKCSATVDPIQVYGSETDTWGVDNLTDIIQDSTFGIVVRLRSHPSWPHSTTPMLRSLELQIY